MTASFQPLPLLRNPHVQTVLGNLLRGPQLPLASTMHQVALPDGDRLAIHDSISDRWRPGNPIGVFVHGLGGDHRSAYLRRIARHLLPHGWRVVRVDLRSCGKGLRLARRPYHAGSSDDVRAVLETVHHWSPVSPLALAGFSLGGNIVLKLAGEAAEHPIPELMKVAAVAPPIDLQRCSDLLALPHNRFYERRFLRELLDLARRRRHCFPDLPRVSFPAPLTVPIFDDLYTAPRNGFAGVADYYQRASAAPLVERIAVPTLIVTARDDPFIAVEPFEALRLPTNVELRILQHGGHLGFLGWDGVGGIRWAERQVVDWLVGPRPSGRIARRG
ncbi:MAG: alpha/beta fold hydrolase [Planctomycetia bacterium]|nr:alpha/beta fold hydrolase [Planctomycetia bacterium]